MLGLALSYLTLSPSLKLSPPFSYLIFILSMSYILSICTLIFHTFPIFETFSTILISNIHTFYIRHIFHTFSTISLLHFLYAFCIFHTFILYSYYLHFSYLWQYHEDMTWLYSTPPSPLLFQGNMTNMTWPCFSETLISWNLVSCWHPCTFRSTMRSATSFYLQEH